MSAEQNSKIRCRVQLSKECTLLNSAPDFIELCRDVCIVNSYVFCLIQVNTAVSQASTGLF